MLPYPVEPRGLVYSTTYPSAACCCRPKLKATLYIECGPPWISRINGYFFFASKLGGLTTQPWILKPSTDVYQISSWLPSAFPKSTSSFTDVSHRGVGCLRSN